MYCQEQAPFLIGLLFSFLRKLSTNIKRNPSIEFSEDDSRYE